MRPASPVSSSVATAILSYIKKSGVEPTVTAIQPGMFSGARTLFETVNKLTKKQMSEVYTVRVIKSDIAKSRDVPNETDVQTSIAKRGGYHV